MSISYNFGEVLFTQKVLVILLLQEGDSGFILVIDNAHDIVTIQLSAQFLELEVSLNITFESLGEVVFLFLELIDGIVEVLVFGEDGLQLGEEAKIRIHDIFAQV
jgi:hypothetical protein